jgi:hypothetical protein
LPTLKLARAPKLFDDMMIFLQLVSLLPNFSPLV